MSTVKMREKQIMYERNIAEKVKKKAQNCSINSFRVNHQSGKHTQTQGSTGKTIEMEEDIYSFIWS